MKWKETVTIFKKIVAFELKEFTRSPVKTALGVASEKLRRSEMPSYEKKRRH